MIIDFRIRAPFGGFKNSVLFDSKDRATFATKFGFEIQDSLRQKSVDILIKEMDEVGIDKAVVPVRKSVNVSNDELMDFLDQYNERFYGMAGIDTLDGENALKEIDKYVLEGPCVGVVMEPGYCTIPMKADDKRNYPIYQKCQDNNIPVFLSFGGLIGPFMDYNDPNIIDHIASDFPELVLILAHGGYPYVNESCYVAFKNDNVYLVPDFYATRVPGGNEYLKATSWIEDKIIYGSGYPVQPVKGMFEYYKANLSEEAFKKVTYLNAIKILSWKKENIKE